MTSESSSELPLAGINVVDMTHVGAGPYCSSLLGQLGADVIKVERPGPGDLSRGSRPHIGNTGISYYFASVNAQKRFVQMDLHSSMGQEVLQDLVARADVLVQNFAPGAIARLGADYETLAKVNPRLIHCSIVGFRKGSGYGRLLSFDYIHEAMSGVMSMTRQPDELPPLPGLPAADMSAALYAVLGIVLAIHMRGETGRGQALEVPLYDSLTSLLPLRLGYSFATGEAFPALGDRHRDYAPFGVFETKDSIIVLTAGSQGAWKRLLGVFPELDKPEFQDTQDRVVNKQALYAQLEPILRSKTTAEWLEIFWDATVPAGAVRTTKEAATDPYVQAIARTLDMGDDSYTWFPYPVVHDAFVSRLDRVPMEAGAHNREVLEELGYDNDKIASLHNAGVVMDPGLSK